MKINSAADLHNAGLGVTPIGSIAWRAVECDRCGNVQVFRIGRNDEQMRSGRW
jgi:ferredoxin-NADP reductase